MTGARPVSTAAPRRDGFAVALAAFLLAALLRQDCGFWDGPGLVRDAAEGRWQHPHHLLLLPALQVWLATTAPLGGTPWERATWLGPVLLGIVAYVLHRAFARLRLDRPHAVLAAALAAGTPALLFHASVVDKYLLGLLGTALAFFAAAALGADSRRRRAVVLGATTTLAYAAHASGAVLPALLLPLAFLHMPAAASRLPLLGLAALVHALGLGLVQVLAAWLDASTSAQGSARFLAGVAQDAWARPGALPRFLLQEWLIPFAPGALLAPFARVGAGGRDLRPLWWFATLGYLAAGFSLIQDFGGYGCYLLPLAPLGALVVAPVLRPGLLTVALLAGLATGSALALAHDDPRRSEALARWVDTNAAPGGACLLLVAPLDLETVVLRRPELPYIDVRALTATAPTPVVEELDLRIRAERARGRSVLLTRAAEEWLRRTDTPLAREILAHLRARRGPDVPASESSAGYRVE